MHHCLTLLVVLSAALLAWGDSPKKPTAVEMRAKLKGEWREFDARSPREKHLAPAAGMEWWLFKPRPSGGPQTVGYLTDWENEAGRTVGELILNVDAEPMWLDFKFTDAGREVVWLGIIRFEGDDLRWVRRLKPVDAKTWAEANGKLPERPTAFQDEKKQPLGYRLERIKNKK
jgi:hypothetical protein